MSPVHQIHLFDILHVNINLHLHLHLSLHGQELVHRGWHLSTRNSPSLENLNRLVLEWPHVSLLIIYLNYFIADSEN
jgi:hypothetical protein